ncbi:hypothetical protein SAMN05444337_2590 [Flavobacterium haoranii]|uniref:Uncharacterized protein n=1 Tax=Flavobacterium haoranii TaxID=683124 RepID=A0A1M6M195_9FLAO|nr:hypothetical protein SAMN05444337_2590 [Flavobacterium haoranii]
MRRKIQEYRLEILLVLLYAALGTLLFYLIFII